MTPKRSLSIYYDPSSMAAFVGVVAGAVTNGGRRVRKVIYENNKKPRYILIRVAVGNRSRAREIPGTVYTVCPFPGTHPRSSPKSEGRSRKYTHQVRDEYIPINILQGVLRECFTNVQFFNFCRRIKKKKVQFIDVVATIEICFAANIQTYY